MSRNDGRTFGGQNLQIGDYLNDSEIDQRFPVDDDNRPRNASTNGMNNQSDLKNNLSCTICLSKFKTGEKNI